MKIVENKEKMQGKTNALGEREMRQEVPVRSKKKNGLYWDRGKFLFSGGC
jgi:hypothetical protein